MLTKLIIANNENSTLDGTYEIGGDWACIIGCSSFCIIGSAIQAAYIAVATTAL